MKTNFSIFTELDTNRLFLRRLTLKDASDLFEIRSNPEMIDFSDQKLDEYIDDTIKFIYIINKGIDKKKWIYWAVINKEDNKLIGSINIWNFNKNENKAEIGYGLNPLYQGRGFMREALAAVTDYGLNTLGLNKIEVWTDRRNIKSIKLIQTCGYKFIREEREMGYYKKQLFNMYIYEIKKE